MKRTYTLIRVMDDKYAPMKKRCYINTSASIHPNGIAGSDGMLHAVEPDYKEIITDANLRRRMSRIIKMGVACGLLCLRQNENREVNAIITATGLGCLTDTEKFLEATIEHDEQLPNPTAFIQSIFNAIGAQIALITGNHSYNNTYVHRGLSFESALLDGMMGIREGNRQALVGAVDEVIASEHMILERLGMLNRIVPGEGAHFFTLTDTKTDMTCAELVDLKTFTGKLPLKEITGSIDALLEENNLLRPDIGLLSTGRNGNKKGDSIYDDIENLFPSASHSTFKNICGEYPTASAFGVWNALNLLKNTDRKPYMLIYNHYYNSNHSLILLKKC